MQKADWQRALCARHGEKTQEKFNRASVAICGLGGLGSHIAIGLARAGIGKLLLIDFDQVELTNLHRQGYKPSQIGRKKTEALKENLLEINPFLQVEVCERYMQEADVKELLAEVDVVCEAFDRAESKAMLVNAVREFYPQKVLVASSGMAGFGDGNEIHTRKINAHFYLCGDERSDVNDGIGLVSARVMLCASHVALKVLQIIKDGMDKGEQEE